MRTSTQVDWARIGIVALILVLAIVTNVVVNVKFSHLADHFPFIGVAVWVAILISSPIRRHDWEVVPMRPKVRVFLLSLVLCASMMPSGGTAQGLVANGVGLRLIPRCSTIFR